ncbi:MAG: hypothetical protein IJC33_06445 [Clostridia bacterium]|nr:hypothetical protein [Clostridia bacterium]
MSRNVKRIVCLLMSLLLLCPLNLVVSAASTEGENAVQPRFTYTNNTSTSLTITTSGTAYCVVDVQGYSNVTKVYIKMTLQKYTVLWWSKVESWEATFNDVTGYISETAQVGSGRYRVKVEITVYSGSDSEEITDYSPEKKVTIS